MSSSRHGEGTSASASKPNERMLKLSARAVDVRVDDVNLYVALDDGWGVSAPVAWFPRLAETTQEPTNG